VGHGALIVLPDMPAASYATKIAANFVANPKQTPGSRCLTQVKPVVDYE
jgi:hypothetical protein